MKLYVSGPMTGKPEKNFPAFRSAAAQLREAGFEVVDPSAFTENVGKSWEECLRRDLGALLECDGVALLPDWTGSKGARLEYCVAFWLNMPAHGVPEWLARQPT